MRLCLYVIPWDRNAVGGAPFAARLTGDQPRWPVNRSACSLSRSTSSASSATASGSSFFAFSISSLPFSSPSTRRSRPSSAMSRARSRLSAIAAFLTDYAAQQSHEGGGSGASAEARHDLLAQQADRVQHPVMRNEPAAVQLRENPLKADLVAQLHQFGADAVRGPNQHI